jgi:hypothetical protein
VNMVDQEQFTFAGFADMHLLLGECHGIASEAMRRYRAPRANTVRGVDRRLRETGSFHTRGHDVWRVRRDAHEEAVLDAVGDDPKQVAGHMGIPHVSVWCVLRDHGLHPYHVQRVQHLLETDTAHANLAVWCPGCLPTGVEQETSRYRTFEKDVPIFKTSCSNIWMPVTLKPNVFRKNC